MIIFEDKEVTFNYDEATGKLELNIPIKTVLEKLPKGKIKVDFLSPYFSKKDVENEYFPRLSGVDFKQWLSMNFEQTKSGKRSLNAYATILNDLVLLAKKYSPYKLSDAISRCKSPKTCTIPYLKAILRNNKNYEEVQSGNKFQKNIENAVKRFM